jgi:hypothetical protein
MRRRAATILAGALTVLSGCAIQADSGPRDVPDDHPARLAIASPVEGGEATGEGRIYLIAPEANQQRLRTVLRNATGEQELIELLARGPNVTELADGLTSELPATLEVNSVRFDGGLVNIDVSDELLDLTDDSLRLAVAQLVYTASELPGSEGVIIRVDGENRSWPDGDGDQRAGPLTVYDFVGYAESSQPAYPVTPPPPPNPAGTTTTPAPTTTTA